MAFLFKSKNKDRHAQPRDTPSAGPAGRVVKEEKHAGTRSTPTGSVNSFDEAGTPSPDVEKYNARRAQQQQEPTQQPVAQAAQQSSSDLPVSPSQRLFARLYSFLVHQNLAV